MRPGNQNKRIRNRSRKGPSPLSRTYESNGPDVKIRGSALHVAEKYAQLSRDAQSAGDRIMAENYLQHAEHYYRIVAAAQQAAQQQNYRDDPSREPRDDDPRNNGERGGYQPSMRDRQFDDDDDEDDDQPRVNGGFGFGAANGAHHRGAEPARPERRPAGNGAGTPSDEQPRIDDAAMAEAGLVPAPASDDDGRTRRRRNMRAPRPRPRQAAGDGGEPGSGGDAPEGESPKDA